jgi:hypothetical protein
MDAVADELARQLAGHLGLRSGAASASVVGPAGASEQ